MGRISRIEDTRCYPEVTLHAACDLRSGRSRPGVPESGKTDESGRLMMTEAGGAAAELRKTATAVSEYAQHQTKQLMDPRNQKALDVDLSSAFSLF